MLHVTHLLQDMCTALHLLQDMCTAHIWFKLLQMVQLPLLKRKISYLGNADGILCIFSIHHILHVLCRAYLISQQWISWAKCQPKTMGFWHLHVLLCVYLHVHRARSPILYLRTVWLAERWGEWLDVWEWLKLPLQVLHTCQRLQGCLATTLLKRLRHGAQHWLITKDLLETSELQ